MAQAIIMAGGEGSRLRPLTCDRPKPMVPMANRPVMEYTVDLLKKHGITDVGVTLQYMPQEITKYFGDGSDHGVNMNFFVEDNPLGTAGSVKNAAGFLKETFVVVSGDALTDFDLSEAVSWHKSKGAMATLVLTPVEIPLEYGVVITEKKGEIRQFLEKPGWGEVFSDTVNTGIYILEPEVLDYIPSDTKFDFSKDLFPFLLKEGKPLYGVSLSGYWCDIGNLRQYLEAHYALMEGRVAAEIKGGLQGDRIYVGQNCNIAPDAFITGPVIIGDGCRIGSGAKIGPYAVLGGSCTADNGASVKRAVVWNGSYIGKQAEIRGAVVCSRVTVKDRSAVYEGAVIGDGSTIEENAKVKPDTKIWPHKNIEKGTTLDNHLIWGDMACRSLFGADGVSGKVNINLTPECAAKLGAVFGQTTGAGSRILISSDNHRSTQMIKTAVLSGLMSAGTEAIDGGALLTPVHRFAVRALAAGGGIHIKTSSRDPEMLHINFFTGQGMSIARDMERKIENTFERDDFQRRPQQEVGTVTYMPGLVESYIANLVSITNRDLIRSRRFRVAVRYTGDLLQSTLPQLLGELGCETAQEIPAVNADLGLIFDTNAEHVVLIDETGRVLSEDRLMSLISYIIMDSSPKPVVAVPVTGSAAIDLVAGQMQGTVIRTKTAPVSFFSEVMKPEVTEAQGRFNQAVIAFDALSTVAKVMDYMAGKNTSLSRIIDRLPLTHMVRRETDCPWPAKGKVMRHLVEETGDKRMELLDGVKVYHEDGWALVLPDAEEPRYHVYSEGFSNEFAESLADFYIDRINFLKKQ